MKISACWIVKNEEANLGRSIESVADIVDELIIVDTGSTDGTVSVAESYGARVEHFEWINDFSAARNYALSFATGDLFIFLDADEWFVPKLGSEDRDLIVNSFLQNKRSNALGIKINHVLPKTGEVIGSSVAIRIFRDPKKLRYSNRIHEVIYGTKAIAVSSDCFCIQHTGYDPSIFSHKLTRNIAILEAALNDSAKGSDKHIFHLMYIIRELHSQGNINKAASYLTELLGHSEVFRRVFSGLNDEIMSCLYAMIEVAVIKREDFSRRDIRWKLIVMVQRVRSNYKGSSEIDLLYQSRFDLKEDRFLRDIEPALRMDAGKLSTMVNYHEKYHGYLNGTAARALWRRGDWLGAFDYAVNALKSGKIDVHWLSILLQAVKGQPTVDIILLLNSVLDVSNPSIVDFLTSNLRRDGYQDIFAYYIKKRQELGPVNADDYLTMLMVYKKYDKLVEFTANVYASGQTKVWPYLFAAAICGAPPELIEPHVSMLGESEKILRAYQNGERIAGLYLRNEELFIKLYALIAFASGIETADQYFDSFRDAPKQCYLAKAAYCETNGLHEPLLGECMDGIEPFDFVCYRYKIQALIFMSRYDEALREIERFFDKELIEQELLHMLLVVAEKATGETGNKARELYKRYIELYDALIDYGDIVKTGIVFDGGGVKLKRAYKTMTREKFDSHLAEESGRAATKALLNMYRKAAEVYMGKNIHAEAARCLCRLVASGRAEKEDYEALAKAFEALGNAALSDYVRILPENEK